MFKLLPNLIAKSRDDSAITINVSEPESYMSLPFYDGIYTVRNITPETSDDLFYFFPENMISGYIDANSEKTLNLISNRKKVVVSIVNSFYHSLLDNISAAVYTIARYPKHELIFDVSELDYSFRRGDPYHNAFMYFLETLDLKKIKYKVVNLKQQDVIYINNFYVADYPFETAHKADLVYEFFKSRISDPDRKPTKNIFVSRSRTVGDGNRTYEAPGLDHPNDNRIDSHPHLDAFFESLGYEVVNTEDFNSFQEQLDYFYEAKTIASLTGSGLTNAVFMRPGQTMIEIVTPLVISSGRPGEAKDITNPFYIEELHNFYKNLSFYKNHTYLAIHNKERSFEKLAEVIENDKRIKFFLDRSND
jgi:hypothetical protein